MKQYPFMKNYKSEIQGDKIIISWDEVAPKSKKYIFMTFGFKIDKISTALGNDHYAKNGKLFRFDT